LRHAQYSSLLQHAEAKVYLSGHDHFRELARIDDGDGNQDNDLYQYIDGTGGPFPPATAGLNGTTELCQR
jgi:hypothetical protein